jgi:hypothetical protein
MFNSNYFFFNLFILLNEQWLAIRHLFFFFCAEKKKNPKGLGDIPQQAGVATTYVASKANACQNHYII